MSFVVNFGEYTEDALVRYQQENPDKVVYCWFNENDNYIYEAINRPRIANSKEEAIGVFLDEFPDLTFKSEITYYDMGCNHDVELKGIKYSSEDDDIAVLVFFK